MLVPGRMMSLGLSTAEPSASVSCGSAVSSAGAVVAGDAGGVDCAKGAPGIRTIATDSAITEAIDLIWDENLISLPLSDWLSSRSPASDFLLDIIYDRKSGEAL